MRLSQLVSKPLKDITGKKYLKLNVLKHRRQNPENLFNKNNNTNR